MSEVFVIPCQHADCKWGKFYMRHEFNDMNDQYCLLADTQKLIAQIEKDDPDMLKHAREKYEGEKEADWLEGNSESNPCKVGVFVFNAHVGNREDARETLPGLTMSGGWAGSLILIQKLKLPYVPISVYKWPGDDEQHMEFLRRLVGTQSLH